MHRLGGMRHSPYILCLISRQVCVHTKERITFFPFYSLAWAASPTVAANSSASSTSYAGNVRKSGNSLAAAGPEAESVAGLSSFFFLSSIFHKNRRESLFVYHWVNTRSCSVIIWQLLTKVCCLRDHCLVSFRRVVAVK